jgi:hypothetical protein
VSSSVVGVDLSSKALDLVKLDESSNRAEWVRVELAGKTAWERTLNVREKLRDYSHLGWWDDVYLVAIEAPMGFRSNALDRVVGAVAASLPYRLRSPERCWVVRPDEWKQGLGLKAKPTAEDMRRLTEGKERLWASLPDVYDEAGRQNGRDAYCLAMWARDTNAKAVADQAETAAEARAERQREAERDWGYE